MNTTITKEDEICLRNACEEYKNTINQQEIDDVNSLGNRTAYEYYKVIEENIEEFIDLILKDYPLISSIRAAYYNEHVMFMYHLHMFLNDKLSNSIVKQPPYDECLETTNEIDENMENKKNFVKEVLDGVPKKKYLKEFLGDIRSYKQFRDDVDNCLMYMNWEKIHKVMEMLDWKWAAWTDEYGDEHNESVPTSYALRVDVLDNIKSMEKYIMEHDIDNYSISTGGFSYQMYVCDEDEDNTVDDYDGRVRFKIQFIVDEYDNGM